MRAGDRWDSLLRYHSERAQCPFQDLKWLMLRSSQGDPDAKGGLFGLEPSWGPDRDAKAAAEKLAHAYTMVDSVASARMILAGWDRRGLAVMGYLLGLDRVRRALSHEVRAANGNAREFRWTTMIERVHKAWGFVALRGPWRPGVKAALEAAREAHIESGEAGTA